MSLNRDHSMMKESRPTTPSSSRSLSSHASIGVSIDEQVVMRINDIQNVRQIIVFFSDMSSHLYNRVSMSVRPLEHVRQSILSSDCLSVSPRVSARIYACLCAHKCMYVCTLTCVLARTYACTHAYIRKFAGVLSDQMIPES